MAIDFGAKVYFPAFNTFARAVVVTPLKSQPLQPAYNGRAVFSMQPLDIAAEDATIFSDQIIVLDIIESEYAVLPLQGDHVHIPIDGNLPDLGDFEIVDHSSNGGGQTSFNLRQIMTSKPSA